VCNLYVPNNFASLPGDANRDGTGNVCLSRIRHPLLDLRNRSLPRAAEPNPPEPPLIVNQAARHWIIYLPLGSTEGRYELRIVTDSGGLLLTATGEATLVSGIATLPVESRPDTYSPDRYGGICIDCRGLERLWCRPGGERSWARLH
jgi:hypothetical protein